MMSIQQHLSGEIAVVTGAGRGLESAIADILADSGAYMIAHDRALEPAPEAADSSRRRGGHASCIASDVADASQVEEAFRQRLAKHGRGDTLVNNAGIGDFVAFPEITPETWDRMVKIHLKGSFDCCHAVFASMKAQQDGIVVNVSSIAGKRGDFSGNAHYTAAKVEISDLTTSPALHAVPPGIDVNAIAPGLSSLSSLLMKWAPR